MEHAPSVSLNRESADGDTDGVAEFDSGITQRVRSVGVRAASVVDLMSIGFSRREADVPLAEAPSRRMLMRFRSLRALGEASWSDISAATGFEDFEVLRLQALMELGRRVGGAGSGPVESIDSPEDVMVLLDDLRFEKREHVGAILLNAKNHIIRRAPIHIGTLTMSIVGPREIFREAIREGASALILAHNHPSGDPTPSPEDIDITRKLVEIGHMLDIPVHDHVIIGERRYVSLRQQGLMNG